jgi:hypothetical protein
MQICRGFTAGQWKALSARLRNEDGSNSHDEDAWRCAIEIFTRRVQERFLSCITALELADTRSDIEVQVDSPSDCSTLPISAAYDVVVPGFAIMALACLLAETLQSFRAKADKPDPSTGPCAYPAGPCIKVPQTTTADSFKVFLQRPSFLGTFADNQLASHFVNGVRNGILHEAETRRWAIWRDEPEGQLVTSQGRGYALNRGLFCAALKNEFQEYVKELRDPKSTDLRSRFRKKMDDLAKEA